MAARNDDASVVTRCCQQKDGARNRPLMGCHRKLGPRLRPKGTCYLTSGAWSTLLAGKAAACQESGSSSRLKIKGRSSSVVIRSDVHRYESSPALLACPSVVLGRRQPVSAAYRARLAARVRNPLGPLSIVGACLSLGIFCSWFLGLLPDWRDGARNRSLMGCHRKLGPRLRPKGACYLTSGAPGLPFSSGKLLLVGNQSSVDDNQSQPRTELASPLVGAQRGRDSVELKVSVCSSTVVKDWLAVAAFWIFDSRFLLVERLMLSGVEELGYFSWIDPELGPFQKSCFLKLKADKTLLEEQLKCKEVTVVAMAERVSLKNDELLYLKSKANDLVEQLKCEKNTAVAMAERLKMKEDELLCLKSKANDLEEQLKCEENIAVAMVERLKMKENELLCLKSKVNDLEKQVQVLSKRNIFRNRIVCVSVVLFVVLLFSLGKGENGLLMLN
ncbi:myosin-6 [Striga asiatica]|uniref:Myosin-6 n=1 Tax=Striga asiatica TaxID=4170 RepID=A0A5A7QRV9_STRAF|nr:myosin-6 [Striga asiatica]